ncbi:histidine kinase [uncultured Maribacter sp.]|uniref:histidine kinase n=1 Tax=uncultured Maribacter sp. TaxID=431308 RepID=UPI0030EF78DF|tara:strand:- start:54342 stop:55184 length:843 start_codon:yes stop_codon:yes gene_type:complete
MDLRASKYRITYEAFSKFSGHISKSRSIEELAGIVNRNIKYLFVSKLLRITIMVDEKPNIFLFQNRGFVISKFKKNILDYEHRLLKNQVPFCEEITSDFLINTVEQNLAKPKLWGWYFNYNKIEVCASVISDEIKTFNNTDVEVLHLLIDNFVTKYQQLLLEKKLKKNNKSLVKAVKLIESKNKQVRIIVENQKKTIDQRTSEIRKKNNKLLEISRLNAHNVREPLSRILGLIDIAEHFEAHELKENILNPLIISANELDDTLKNIVEKSAGEINGLAVE